MLRTSLKKAVVLGLFAALPLGSGMASAMRDPEPPVQPEPPVTFVGGSCDNNDNVGINLSLCGIAAPLNLLGILGTSDQTALAGGFVSDDDAPGPGAGGSCNNNRNVGINLSLCGLAAPLGILNIGGENEQTALGGGGDCTNEDNVGINLSLCRISLPLGLGNILGENEQFAATP